MGPEEGVPARRAPARGRARHGRHLRRRGRRRQRPVASRGRADHRGPRVRMPVGRELHLDPQHGRGHDRPLRQRRATTPLATRSVFDDPARQLLSHRGRGGLGRRGPSYACRPRRRRVRAQRRQAVHLRLGLVRHLRRDGAHQRRRRTRDHRDRRRRRHSGPLVRRRRGQDGLERPADPRGAVR